MPSAYEMARQAGAFGADKRIAELEEKLRALAAEHERVKKVKETLQMTCQEYEQRLMSAEAERDRLEGEIESMQKCLDACNRVKNRVVAERDRLEAERK